MTFPDNESASESPVADDLVEEIIVSACSAQEGSRMENEIQNKILCKLVFVSFTLFIPQS